MEILALRYDPAVPRQNRPKGEGMRRFSLIVCTALLLGTVNLTAETVKECKAKCLVPTKHKTNVAMCNDCCDDRLRQAHNQCTIDAFNAARKCGLAAKGDDQADQVCADKLAAELKRCADEKEDLNIAKYKCEKH
ncbi:MAG TPA: hypothetical protein VL284_00590 [Thermoanaerobaculia bacterium]|nr:hypothetical protein [Thermoanaerobaculia bacterium]